MTSTTSGTSSFSLDVDELIDQAKLGLGGEHVSAVDSVNARRTLNLLLIQLQNKNIPISKLRIDTLALTQGTTSYTVTSDVVDVLTCSIKLSGTEIPITRYGIKEYNNIPRKDTQNRPNLYTVQRLDDQVNILFWPVPNNNNYSASMVNSIKIQDINAAYQKVDLSTRYLPLLVKWLTYDLACITVGIPEEIKNRAEKDYKECMTDTFDEDRERSDFIVRIDCGVR